MARHKTEEQKNRLEKWFEFTQKLYSTLDLNQASRIALDVALQLTGMERGMLLTRHTSETFRFRHAQNQNGRTLHQDQFTANEALLNDVATQRKPVFTKPESSEIKSILALPLIVDLPPLDHVIGVMYFDSPRDLSFGPAEQETANVFLMHASPALQSVILYDWATRDSRTGLYQRHYFDAMSQNEWRRSLRHKHPVTVLKVDVDHLREYNDLYGRTDGDMVLTKTAEILKEICRTEDLISRYDADEFAVLLPVTDTGGARPVANRITEEVPLLLTRDPERPVTVSIGGATFPRCSVNNISDLLRLADSALQQAKQSGGKRAILYEPALTNSHRRLF